MGLNVDWESKIVEITSPTTSVDAQELHDFIEDSMATAIGMCYDDIIQPEGKVEDPANPGVYSQIIIIFNSPWQIQFWGGSGYTRIYGGKIVGGLNDQPVKATGTAGDITVLESPVDGLTVAVESIVPAVDIADAVWADSVAQAWLADISTLMNNVARLLGIAGENIKWSSIIHNADNLLTSATITQYDDNTLTTPINAWDITATYNAQRELSSYNMVQQ